MVSFFNRTPGKSTIKTTLKIEKIIGITNYFETVVNFLFTKEKLAEGYFFKLKTLVNLAIFRKLRNSTAFESHFDKRQRNPFL